MRACRDPRVMAVKGAARRGLDRHADRHRCLAGRQKLRRGIKVFTVAVGIAKLEFSQQPAQERGVGDDGVTTGVSDRLRPPAADRRRVHPAALRQQLITRRDRNGFPVREVAKDARAQ